MTRLRVLAKAALLAAVAAPASASTVLNVSIEDHARLSKFVVVGKVVAQQGRLDPGNGIETAITLKVSDSLKGARKGDVIVFHTRGGEFDGVISQAVGDAVFKTGQTYLVFIEEIDGRLYNIGLSTGVWDIRDGRPKTFVRAVQDGLLLVGDADLENGPISYQDMVSRVRFTLTHPTFENTMLRETFGARR
jgi:hypothetical protein